MATQPVVRRLTEDEGIGIAEDAVGQRLRMRVRREVVAFLADLANTARPDRGAGVLGFNGGLNYPSNSIGAAVKALILGGTGGNGGNGASAGFTDFIFRRAPAQPETPTGDGTPQDWFDAPPAPNGQPLWFSTGEKTALNALVGAWAAPVRLDGTDGEGVEVEFSVDGNSGWHPTFSAGDLFMRQRKGVGAWSVGWRVVGEKGTIGDPGPSGQNSATVTIYQRGETAPPLPSAVVVYTFATALAAGLNNGWQQGIPSGSGPLWATLASAVNSAPTDALAPGEWTTQQKVAENGSAGLNSATVFLYQRTNTANPPALPSDPIVYTFATGVATGANNSWQQGLPATGGAYRWLTTGTAASSGASDTIIPTEWAGARLLAQDGEAGAPALSVRLSQTAAIFAADSTGLVDPGQSFPVKMTLLLGANDDTANWVISRTASDPSITTTLAGDTVTITGIGTALETGLLQITGTRAGYPTQTLGVNVFKNKRATPSSGPVTNIAPLYSEGFSLSPNDALASIEFLPNGQIQKLSNLFSIIVGNWYLPTTANIGASYQITLTRISGDDVDVSAGVLDQARYATISDQTNGFSFKQSSIAFSIKTLAGVPATDGLIFLDTAIEV
jgi:hypothetical protein